MLVSPSDGLAPGWVRAATPPTPGAGQYAVFVGDGWVISTKEPTIVGAAQETKLQSFLTAKDLGATEENYASLRSINSLSIIDKTVVRVLGRASNFDGGEGQFYLDVADVTSADNGGTVLVDSSGRRWKRVVDGAIHADWFGAIPNNLAAAASNYVAIRAALAACITHNPRRLEGHYELVFGNGEYFITGNSPLMFNRTQMLQLPGAYRYRRGIKFQGAGKHATILTLVTTGASDQWFYDTFDGNYPSDNSVADYIHFDGFTFRGTTTTNAQPAGSKTNAFNLRSHGWEKFLTWTNCHFEYLDTVFHISGYGNVDHLRWYGCHFSQIRDRVFYFNNNQSVANHLFGCDAESIYGRVIEVGPEGGGDLAWFGGAIVLDPDVDALEVQNANQTQKGFVYWDNSGVTSGLSSGHGNCKFTFHQLRFETYTSSQPFVFTRRTDEAPYGLLEVVFQDCSMTNPAEYQVNAIPSVPYVGVSVQNATMVRFERCDLHYTYTFEISKHAPQISFKNCRYISESPITDYNMLAGKCKIVGGGGSIKASGTFHSNHLLVQGDYSKVVSLDFNKMAQAGPALTATVNGKDPQRGWPQPVLMQEFWTYFPEGSIVLGVLINKPGEVVTNPASDYGLQVKDSAGNTLFSTPTQSQTLPILQIKDFPVPAKIPAAPNNYLSVSAVGSGTSSLFQDKSGGVFFTYI